METSKQNDLTHYLAIDYGENDVGLAIFKSGQDPYPLCFDTIRKLEKNSLYQKLFEIILSEDINHILIGIPYLTDGTSTQMTVKAQLFSQEFQTYLKNKINNPPLITLRDETLTSFEAKDRMLNSPMFNFKINYSKIDEISASIILEEYLNELKSIK